MTKNVGENLLTHSKFVKVLKWLKGARETARKIRDLWIIFLACGFEEGCARSLKIQLIQRMFEAAIRSRAREKAQIPTNLRN